MAGSCPSGSIPISGAVSQLIKSYVSGTACPEVEQLETNIRKQQGAQVMAYQAFAA
jgi:hypothetical protein